MTGETSPYSGREVTDYLDGDYRLRDAEGDEVGRIVEINEDFIVVERGGGLLALGERNNVYVPRENIVREDDTDWFLNIDEDQLDSMGWTERPDYESTEYQTSKFQATDYQGADYQVTQEQTTDYGRTEDVDRGPAATGRSGQGTRLVRYEEDLEAQKVSREAGEITVGKRVVEDTKTIEVPVRREEIEIERRPVTADASVGVGADDAFSDERISVPLMEEQVEVRRVARPVEEVEITKTATEDTRRVDETVRREEFDIDDNTTGSRSHDEEGLR